ncbi:MAG: hypothetical protein ACREV9_06590 [Burkholderiales bacterium]
MAVKLLICVSAMQSTVGVWKHGHLSHLETLKNDSNGWTGFGHFLRAHRGIPAHIMVDTVKEDYRFETLPHTFGRDRQDMVERKLKQLYRNTPYVAASKQGQIKAKRTEDQYLFNALTSSDLLDSWLKVIEVNQTPLAAIYLLPTVSELLLTRLNVTSGNILMITHQAGGVRQSFFRERKLRLSRLTQGEGGSRVQHAKSYAEEISNTRFYLDSLRICPLDESLTVLILDQDGSLSELPPLVTRADILVFNKSDLAQRLKARVEYLEAFPDALHLHVLGKQAPANNLVPQPLAIHYRRYVSRNAIHIMSGGAAVTAILVAGLNLFQANELDAQAKDAARQARQLQASYQRVTQEFPATPVSAESLRKVVEIAHSIDSRAQTPETLFRAVSGALETHPQVVLNRIEWKSAPLVGDEAGENKNQSGLIEAEIRPFKGDYRAAMAAINGFADKLKADPKVAWVRIAQLPINLNPEAALSGNTIEARGTDAGASFTLEVGLRGQT